MRRLGESGKGRFWNMAVTKTSYVTWEYIIFIFFLSFKKQQKKENVTDLDRLLLFFLKFYFKEVYATNITLAFLLINKKLKGI